MSRPSTPSKGSSSHRQDVMKFLDDLDSFSGPSEEGASSVAPTSTAPAARSKPAASAASTSKTASSAKQSKLPPAVASTGAGDDKDAQEVLDFLDDIVASRDARAAKRASGISPTPSSKGVSGTTSTLSRSGSRNTLNKEAGASTSTTAGRKSTDSARSVRADVPSASGTSSVGAQAAEKLAEVVPPQVQEQAAQAGGWGWGSMGSVWNSASSMVQQAKTVAEQARTVAEEQVSKNLNSLPKNLSSLQSQLPASPIDTSSASTAATAQAARWRSGVANLLSSLENVDVDKLRQNLTSTGLNTLKEIMNAVAPPISEHEVIEVWLSHDMKGYEGVETLVYRAMAKIMEQVEGGDLVVNKGSGDDQPSASAAAQDDDDEDERNLNLVEGFTEGYKLGEANLEALIKRHGETTRAKAEKENTEEGGKAHGRSGSTASISVPVTICPIFMRIQPILSPMPFDIADATASATSSSTSPAKHLYFLLLLRDPNNELVHRTLSQSMPSSWLDIPFEENEWVEDIMVDVIRRAVEILGEEYVKGRMGGRLFKNAKNAEAQVEEVVFDGESEEKADNDSKKAD